MKRLRLLPAAIAAMVVLSLVKAGTLLGAAAGPSLSEKAARARSASAITAVSRANAALAPPTHPASRASASLTQAMPAALPPDPVAASERAVLEALRERRAELEKREEAVATRELMIAAAEQRLARRIEEMTSLQERLEALERGRAEREDAGWRGLVRLYEGMRPRDAAAIFNELEMPVLVEILDRMAERKAAPVIGAMRTERAREVTAELARHRARSVQGE